MCAWLELFAWLQLSGRGSQPDGWLVAALVAERERGGRLAALLRFVRSRSQLERCRSCCSPIRMRKRCGTTLITSTATLAIPWPNDSATHAGERAIAVRRVGWPGRATRLS